MKLTNFNFNLRNVKINPPSLAVPIDFQEKLKLFIVPVIAALLSAGILLFVVKPKVGEIFQLRAQVREKEKEVELLAAKVDELEKLDVRDLEAKAKLLNRAIPVDKDVPGAVIGLERLLGEAGLSINSISLSPGEVATEAAEFGKLEISLDVMGTYSQLINFIKNINKSLRLFSIRNLKVKVLTETSLTDPDVSAGFTILTYFAPVPKSAGENLTKPLPVITNEEEQLLIKLSEFRSVSDVLIPTSGPANSPIESLPQPPPATQSATPQATQSAAP